MRNLIQSAVVMGALLYAFTAGDFEKTGKKINKGEGGGRKGRKKGNEEPRMMSG